MKNLEHKIATLRDDLLRERNEIIVLNEKMIARSHEVDGALAVIIKLLEEEVQ